MNSIRIFKQYIFAKMPKIQYNQVAEHNVIKDVYTQMQIIKGMKKMS